MTADGGLFHAFKENRSYIDGFLEDYAHMTSALISLFELSGKVHYLNQAENLTLKALEDFYNRDENIFYSTSRQDRIISKNIELNDVTLPSPNAVIAHNLFRLAKLTGTSSYEKKAELMIYRMAEQVKD